MPVASTSNIEIAQRACTLAGLSKPSTFEDPDNEVSQALNDIYEDLVTDALTIHPWRFAIHTEILGPPIQVPAVGPPPHVHQRYSPPGFSAAYALPTTPAILQLRTVYTGGSLAAHYKIMGNDIWIDASPSETVEIEAIWRLEETQWPPWFKLYVILRVASFLGGAVTRNGELATFHANEAEKQLVRSRTRDSQQQTTSKIRLVKVRSTRLGGRPY